MIVTRLYIMPHYTLSLAPSLYHAYYSIQQVLENCVKMKRNIRTLTLTLRYLCTDEFMMKEVMGIIVGLHILDDTHFLYIKSQNDGKSIS